MNVYYECKYYFWYILSLLVIKRFKEEMGIEKKQIHRPGVFKQTNKEHKHGRHRSKSSISNDSKGITLICFTNMENFLIGC